MTAKVKIGLTDNVTQKGGKCHRRATKIGLLLFSGTIENLTSLIIKYLPLDPRMNRN
jgi:hypothetical protein